MSKNIKTSLSGLVILAAAANAQLRGSRYFVYVRRTSDVFQAGIFNSEEARSVVGFDLLLQSVDISAIDKITSMLKLTLHKLDVETSREQLRFHTQLRRLVVLALCKNWVVEITTMNAIKIHPSIIGPCSFLRNDDTDKARLSYLIKKVQGETPIYGVAA